MTYSWITTKSRYLMSMVSFLIVTNTAGAKEQMREVDQHFIDQRASQASLFKTLPGTHITPVNNRMIFTLMVNTLDAKVKGQSQRDHSSEEQLRVRSYNVAPYVALSGKHFGGGVSAELGEAWTRYDQSDSDLKERSSMRYQGLGVHMFYTPMEKSSRARLTFVAGTKVLSVKHKASSSQDQLSIDAGDWEKQQYQVSRSRVGANLDLRILDSFSLIPWIDHNYTYSDDLSSRLNHPNEDKSIALTQRFAGDNEIYWQPGSRWLYGLDAALRIKHFEIHFGNLLGAALNQKSGSERIENHAYSVSVIFLTPTDD